MTVLAIAGLFALTFSLIAFDVWRKDKAAGHKAAFGGLVAVWALLGLGVVAWAVGWLFAHLYGLG